MSTSSRAVIAGPLSDEVIRPPAMVVSGEPSESSSSSFSLSNLTQAFPFSSGNPRIEETRGVMHLYREDPTSSSASDLPVSPFSYSYSIIFRNSSCIKLYGVLFPCEVDCWGCETRTIL